MRNLLILLVLLPSLGYSEEKICKGNKGIVDDCYAIRGRLSIYNGTPSMRIWKVGTKRILAVTPSEDEIIPNNLKKQIGIGKQIYGDFVVCPFEKEKEGHMQSVCVESAKNMRIEDYSENLNKPKTTFIKECTTLFLARLRFMYSKLVFSIFLLSSIPRHSILRR